MRAQQHTTMLRESKLKPYFQFRKGKLAHVPNQGYTGVDMARAYLFPSCAGLTPPTVYLLELGGTWDQNQLASWCSSRGFPYPNIRNINLTTPTSDPGGANVEVGGDICVVIGTAAAMFGQVPMNIGVINADNSDSGFLDGWTYPAGNAKPGDTESCSWGGSENTQGNISQMEDAIETNTKNGNACTAASGDNGPDDGTNFPVSDYPGCSAWALGCGATTIALNPDGSLKSETPWNSGGGASGGGFSKIIQKPSYQNIPSIPGSFRGEPDWVANGDPASGWDTMFGVVGGTSMVAPFMATYIAGVNALLMKAGLAPLGLPQTLLYQHPECFNDIVSGSIGSGFPAGPGWDAASGLGSIIGSKFASAALGGVVNPPPPPTSATVPNVVGVSWLTAKALLQSSGLQIAPAAVPDPTVKVTGQSTPAGQTVPTGSVITVTLAGVVTPTKYSLQVVRALDPSNFLESLVLNHYIKYGMLIPAGTVLTK